ncbi:MAG: hypothetical protein ABR543_07260 [Gemmatimonadaceae bacterium]
MIIMNRITRAALSLAMFLPVVAIAQDPQQQAYEARRQSLVKELQDTQNQMSDIRNQRLQLEARVENAIAQSMSQRAQELLMSGEQTALQQLDGMLTVAQDNMQAQRDRMRALGEAVRRRTGAVLVVLLRADSSGAQTLGAAELQVDGAVGGSRTYTVTSNSALQAGAVDQLYRSNVLPTAHTVALSVTVNGQTVVQTLNVNAGAESVTYVQFAVRNGQVVATTWTSQGTTPF